MITTTVVTHKRNEGGYKRVGDKSKTDSPSLTYKDLLNNMKNIRIKTDTGYIWDLNKLKRLAQIVKRNEEEAKLKSIEFVTSTSTVSTHKPKYKDWAIEEVIRFVRKTKYEKDAVHNLERFLREYKKRIGAWELIKLLLNK
jgi:hypothetical protein